MTHVRRRDDVQTYLAQDSGVAENDQAILCSGQRNVETSRVVQEPDALVLVAPDTGQNDVVLLSALESINAGNFDLLVEILSQGAVELHEVCDVRSLTFVGCDDTDLGWHDTRLEESGDNLFDVGSLGSADVCSNFVTGQRAGLRNNVPARLGFVTQTHLFKYEVPLELISSCPRFWWKYIGVLGCGQGKSMFLRSRSGAVTPFCRVPS